MAEPFAESASEHELRRTIILKFAQKLQKCRKGFEFEDCISKKRLG